MKSVKGVPENISDKIRIKEAFLVKAIEIVHSALHVFVLAFFFVALNYYYFYLRMRKNFLFIRTMVILVDFSVVFIITVSSARNGLFAAYLVNAAMFGFTAHTMALTRSLRRFWYWVSSIKSVPQTVVSRKLARFYFDHHATTYWYVKSNDTMSPIMTGYFLTNIGLNVYAFTMIYFARGWTGYFRIMLHVLVLIQIIGPFIALLPSIGAGKSIHACVPLLRRFIVTHKTIRSKWKCLQYYEQFHRKNKLTQTVGTLGKITTKTLFEV